jgi:hypothetical protein
MDKNMTHERNLSLFIMVIYGMNKRCNFHEVCVGAKNGDDFHTDDSVI